YKLPTEAEIGHSAAPTLERIRQKNSFTGSLLNRQEDCLGSFPAKNLLNSRAEMSAKIVQICAFLLLTPAILGRPQDLFTFKDGKVGVNFGGYHAAASLGGLLTGNAAHGGLSASAGTPYGQQAGAGLGGSVDGRTAGGLFAGASAGGGVGDQCSPGGKCWSRGWCRWGDQLPKPMLVGCRRVW
uniref:Uncharacterized protein n=1 Tax=Lutzomyia longipalpis TaxID=7200 RepID=A0A1B0CQK6_LUTLO